MRLNGKLLSAGFVASVCLMNWCPSARAYDWQPPPNKITVLAVFAHPDDEGIFFGGARKLLHGGMSPMADETSKGHMRPRS